MNFIHPTDHFVQDGVKGLGGCWEKALPLQCKIIIRYDEKDILDYISGICNGGMQ